MPDLMACQFLSSLAPCIPRCARFLLGEQKRSWQFLSEVARRSIERGDDPVDVVDAPAPRAAARALQRRPEAAVVGQTLVGRKARMRRPAAQQRLARVGVERHAFRAHEVDAAGQRIPVDHDLDEDRRPERVRSVRPSSASGADVADARPGRHAGEPPVGEERHALCPRAGSGARS
mgnify:CR=1 FL=1